MDMEDSVRKYNPGPATKQAIWPRIKYSAFQGLTPLLEKNNT